jgi:hypothetical protein
VKYGLAPVIPLALAMLGIACGGPSEEEQRQQAREEREYRQDLREYRQDVRQLQRERAEYRRCIAALGDLKDALDALDSRLAVGLNYDEYGTEVGDIVVVYDNSDLTGLGHECLQRVGLKLERALQEYQKAFRAWDECFDDIDCDIDGIEETLQPYWNRASTALLAADIGMTQLEPVANPQRPRKPASLEDE